MKIGVIYPQTELQGDPEAVRRIRLATEELGYDHLLVYDHVLGATHDRGALNPRPRRVIPIWLSGFVDAALRRAALIGDGFIFADGAVDALEQLQRLRQLLKEAGRSDAGFGLHCNMIRAKTPEAVVETLSRWRDSGGTHARSAEAIDDA